jgi:hypothetical protein
MTNRQQQIKELNDLAGMNLHNRKRRILDYALRNEPDYYHLEYDLGTRIETLEYHENEQALEAFDACIRAGAKYALLRAEYLMKDASGELYVNLGLHDITYQAPAGNGLSRASGASERSGAERIYP